MFESQIRDLIDFGLVSEDEIRTAIASLSNESRLADIPKLSRLLVERGLLTPFQASEIDAGRGASLVLGNYVIFGKIGEGGMGLVLKARHRRMDRVVALKVLSPKVTGSPERLARFHREVRAAARLEHPNIVAAYDADESRGVHYLAMQYVEGRDMAALVKRSGPVDLVRCLDFVLQAARGLEYAHSRGVIHRDVKPANLLLDEVGRVRILDLGLARILEPTEGLPETDLTSSGAMMGTADYMAPEQSLDAGDADARSDIYSLGCTLHFLLTGRAVYGGDSVLKRLLAHRDQPVPKLAERVPGVTPVVEAVFQRMIAKQPGDRFPTMARVVAALEALGCEPESRTRGVWLIEEAADGSLDVTREAPTISALDGSGVVKDMRSMAASRSGRRGATGLGRQRTVATVCAVCVVIALTTYVASKLAAPQVNMIGVAHKPDTRSAPNAKPSVPTPDSPPLVVAPSRPEPTAAPFDKVAALAHQKQWAEYLGLPVEYVNNLGMSFRLIPPGVFDMGSTPAEIEAALSRIPPNEMHWRNCVRSEGPRLRVEIDEPFYMATYQTTQSEYFAATGRNPSDYSASGPRANLVAGLSTDRFPVDCVNWNDATAFASRVNELEGLPVTYRATGSTFERVPGDGYRLPAEAEWEYAVRAGTTTRYWNGDSDLLLREIARHTGNHTGRTHAVGELAPNPWGLFDTYGNVWAWCEETWVPPSSNVTFASEIPFKVIRGGYWNCSPLDCRSAAKGAHRYHERNCALGCRLVVSARAVKKQLTAKAAQAASPQGPG